MRRLRYSSSKGTMLLPLCRRAAALLLGNLCLGCGTGQSPSLGGLGGAERGDCELGEVPWETSLAGGIAEVCVASPPTEDAYLATPEYVDGDPESMTDAPRVDCVAEAFARQPDAEAPELAPMGGLVTKFGKAPQPKGLCVAALNEAAFMALPCLAGSVDEQVACLGQDLCSTCSGCAETPGGPGCAVCDTVVGWTISVPETAPFEEEDDDDFGTTYGRYRIDDLPTDTNLVIRVSGPETHWADTYKYGIRLRSTDYRPDDQLFEQEAPIISRASWRTVPSTARVPRGIQPGHGAIAGSISDCGGEVETAASSCDLANECRPGDPCDCSHGHVCRPNPAGEGGRCQRVPWSVVGATVGLSRRAASIAYFQGREGDNLPQPGRRSTNILGTFAAIDLPAGETTVVSVARVAGEPVRLGQSTLYLAPNSIAVIALRGGWTGHFPWYK